MTLGRARYWTLVLTPLAWTSVVCLGACGDDESAPQVIRGTLLQETFSFRATQIRALDEEKDIAALDVLDGLNRFVLALPPGGTYVLEVSSADGKERFSFDFAPIEVCAAEAALELGELYAITPCKTPTPCEQAALELDACRQSSGSYCAQLGSDLNACRQNLALQCQDEDELFMRCLLAQCQDGMDPMCQVQPELCPSEEERRNQCYEQWSCETQELLLQSQCIERDPCEDLLFAQQRICEAEPMPEPPSTVPGPCLDTMVDPVVPMPAIQIGCGDDGTFRQDDGAAGGGT